MSQNREFALGPARNLLPAFLLREVVFLMAFVKLAAVAALVSLSPATMGFLKDFEDLAKYGSRLFMFLVHLMSDQDQPWAKKDVGGPCTESQVDLTR